MANVLTEADVLRIIKEEWKKRLDEVDAELSVMFKPSGTDGEIDVISPELKVKHVKTGYRYTVDATSTNSVSLRSPEGDIIDVSHEQFEAEFELD